jgi:hypothetical protein
VHCNVLRKLKLQPLIIDGMKGFGDNIYQRAFVREIVKTRNVYLSTPYPELYEDLGVKFINMQTPLRTQSKNIARQTRSYCARPKCEAINPSYNGHDLRTGSIIKGMSSKFGIKPKDYSLPSFENVIKTEKPICVVRPATIRSEWKASARNPNPDYIFDAIERARNDYFVVSVADISPPHEIALNPLPYADLSLNSGELDVKQLLGLIQAAKLVIGGVGWIVPACIATQTPLFCILGGNGKYNAPEKITDEAMDLRKVYFAKPDNYCHCENMTHNCDKNIINLNGQIDEFIRSIR